jgi:hypothetical protein
MGVLKTLFLILAPIGAITVSSFRLGKQLPKACRLFGNHLALSYVYFKAIIRLLKPADHLPLQVISLARKTSQQVTTTNPVASTEERAQFDPPKGEGGYLCKEELNFRGTQ